MLSIERLYKSYGKIQALDGVDLNIDAGETCCLIGPNGAGKTSLVSIVAGIRRPDSGSIHVGGVDVTADPFAARRLLGVAPQELGIYPTVTVRQNLVLFAELAGLRGMELARRVDEIAETLELTDLLGRAARDLSGGEKRRLHTAMGMVHGPPLLLLDEPTAGVDVATRTRLLGAVRDLAEQRGTAICYSTHYLPEVEALGGSVAIIDHGRIIVRGSVGELVSRYARSAVELRFDGAPPPLSLGDGRVERFDSLLRVYTEDPAAETARILGLLGEAAPRLRGVEVVSAGLESVFMTLTGRRYEVGERANRESIDVVAS
jgi:ABC-2 type transport system ATP-binding protein